MTERKEWTFQIEGMTCEHCAKTIDDTLRRIPGVVQSSTSYIDRQTRVVTEASINEATLTGEIEGKGYRVARNITRPRRGSPAPREGEEFDLLIIGAGSAGFSAAIRAAELGASAAIIEGGARHARLHQARGR